MLINEQREPRLMELVWAHVANGELEYDIDGSLKKEKEVVLKAVAQDGLALQFADASLKT